MEVKITKVINHGEFLQTFATVAENGEEKEVSFCHNSLPFTEDGVFSALASKFYEPVVEESSRKDKTIPPGSVLDERIIETPYVPDVEKIAEVKRLEDSFKALRTKVVRFQEEIR